MKVIIKRRFPVLKTNSQESNSTRSKLCETTRPVSKQIFVCFLKPFEKLPREGLKSAAQIKCTPRYTGCSLSKCGVYKEFSSDLVEAREQ